MTRATFDRWLVGAMGLIVLLAAAAALTLHNTRRLNENSRWVAHTHEVIDLLQEINGSLREAEAQQRTFVITVGEEVQPAFAAAISAAKESLAKVQAQTKDNREQQARVTDVRRAADDLAEFWTNTMQVRREQGFEPARQIVASGQSRRMMAQLRARLQEMELTERQLLLQRDTEAAQSYYLAIVTGLLSGAAAVAGVISFMYLLRRHLSAKTAAAAVIAEQAERLRTTLASIGDAVLTTDAEGRVTGLNAVAQSLTGWTATEATGRPLTEVFRIVNEETRQPVENPATRALHSGAIVGLANHTLLIAKDGSERPIDDSAAPIRCQDGEIVGCVLVFRDVTHRRELEKQNVGRLLDARLLASIVESSHDAIISKTLDGMIQTWNAAAERLFGYSAEEAIGRHISLVIPRDRQGEEEQIIAQLKCGQRIEHFDTVRLHKDGRLVLVSLTISPLKDDAGRVVGASKIARDVTRLRQAESDRQKFITLVESSTDFIAMCDLQGVPFFVNRAGLQMVGLASLDEARQKPVREFFFPEDQSRIVDEFFPAVLREGHGETDVRFRNFKTGDERWMAYKVLTITDTAGQPQAFATVSQDITERRRMEDNLRSLAADLSEADRRKDEFLATLAHELRNPLAPLRNALQLLGLETDPAAKEHARSVMGRQLDQLVRLVDDLLDVSRITRGKLELRREQIELATVILNAVETSRPTIDQMGHQLTVELPSPLVVVDADLTRLSQVFANLLNNSAKYMDRGGQIWLTAERRGNEVVISVKDTGIGIDADHLTHIFDMFSQVAGARERSQGGLGIGLSLVKHLVEMHGGRITAHSAGLGHGAEFIVTLPLSKSDQPAAGPGGSEQSPARSSLRVLIVDDNRDGADSLAMLLRLMGNQTRTAYDGQAGVQAAAEFRPDVVLLDIGLPRLNGIEACRHIRAQSWGRDILLIALTGWGQDEDRRQTTAAGFDHHLVKPVNPTDLTTLLAHRQPNVSQS